jgi:large subunit ribosomal protein L1
MAKHGKKYLDKAQLVDRTRSYSPGEALSLVKETSYSSFDGTVETHMHLNVDPRKADQQVRSVVQFPHGTGRKVRVLVFAEGEAEKIAEGAGADYVGIDDLIKRIQEGWLEFDVAIAIPQVMGKVGRLGKILGTRGLMPNPKAGTIVPAEDLPRLIDELHKGRVEFRIDKTANLHVPIGKVSFSAEQLVDNFTALMDAVIRAKPATAKGQYIKKIVVTSTMGPGVKIDIAQAMSLRAG